MKLRQSSCHQIGTFPKTLRMANAKIEGVQVLDHNWSEEKKTNKKNLIFGELVKQSPEKRYMLLTIKSE